jgi:transcriptional regulator with XRE-family HTH domain
MNLWRNACPAYRTSVDQHAMKNSLRSRLAKKLKELRGDKTIRVFADELGLSKSTLHKLEQGEQNLSLDQLQRICDALKCDIAELFSP